MLVSKNEINKKVFLDFFDEEQLLTIFDVGTYDGKDSLEFKKLFSKSIIYSFEADKRSVDVFNKVVTDTEDINLIETALSDVDGQIDWYAVIQKLEDIMNLKTVGLHLVLLKNPITI